MTTSGGLLLVASVLVPFTGVMLAVVLGGRNAQRVAAAVALLGLGIALAIARELAGSDEAIVYLLGGWRPPLGITLRADGLAVVMMVAVAVVTCGIVVYACADFGTRRGAPETRASLTFWALLMAIWGSLNLVFVSGDLFTFYVALELLTFAGVPLVCLDGKPDTLRAALRYLLFALAGSVFYLLGVVLLFAAYGTLDVATIGRMARPEPVTWVAAGLITVGLLAKTALFPLHLWLPPAHAGAPAAASAILSALVVKGSWFLVVRIWFDALAAAMTLSATQLLGALGVAAILVGNLVALRQARLKLLIAYSTVAQIGYLFLMFPLAGGLLVAGIDPSPAMTGGMLQAISHATAKAAMFMAAGLAYKTLGHDRVGELAGLARTLPMTVLAFALGGASLIGLPPSGGFWAKWLLASAAFATGQWWWAFAMLVGGLLTSVYVFTVVVRAMATPAADWTPKSPVPRYQQVAILLLATCSFVLGALAWLPVDVAAIGRP